MSEWTFPTVPLNVGTIDMTKSPENQKFRDDAAHTKLNLLLFQLSESVKIPPTIVDLYDWRYNVDYVMGQIKELAPDHYNRLDDLVTAVQLQGQNHITDIDADEAVNVIAHSSEHYFEKVSMLISEINHLKSL